MKWPKTDSACSQHFYAELVQLHRPFAQFKQFGLRRGCRNTKEVPASSQGDESERQVRISRMLCFDYAIKLTEVIKEHYARQDVRGLLFYTVDHIELAASTLYTSLLNTLVSAKRSQAKEHLQQLLGLQTTLGELYPVANQMAHRLDDAIRPWLPGKPATNDVMGTFLGESSLATSKLERSTS